MNMDIFGIALFCICTAILAIVLKQYKPEYAVILSLACAAIVVLYITTGIADIYTLIVDAIDDTLISDEMLSSLFKCLGICVIAELAAQTCHDAGEGAIGTKLELSGKVALIVVSMPMFIRIFKIASGLLNI